MRKLALVLAATVVALGLALVGPSSVDAGNGGGTSQVYAVHGLNLEGQTTQSDGGTAVTVCAGSTALDADFQFGEIAGPVPLPTGSAVSIQVYLGAGNDCSAPTGDKIIDQTIDSVPAGTVALVATSMGQELSPELVPIPLNTECVDPGTGRLTGAHVANAGPVTVKVNGGSAGEISYGQSLDADLPAGTVQVEVTSPVNFGPAPVEVLEANNRIVYVVGNQPGLNGMNPDSAGPTAEVSATPVVVLIQDLPLETCETPTEPEPEPEAAQQPRVVQARPTFTG